MDEDFSTVFTTHARLYLLGDKYDITDLKSLALEKLHQTLLKFQLYESRIGDVLNLVRYVYENGPQDHEDSLRDLVTGYVVTEVDVIGKSSEFSTLLEEGGMFVSAFWTIVKTELL